MTASASATNDKARQDAMTPDEVLATLLEGNKRFREGRTTSHDLLRQVAATRTGQWPLAAVVGCIDSRVSPEIVFDVGIGDVFTARVAGNVVNADILGSPECACKVAGAKLVMVKGHTHCGAVKGACAGVELGHLTGLLGRLSPAIRDVERSAAGPHGFAWTVTFASNIGDQPALAPLAGDLVGAGVALTVEELAAGTAPGFDQGTVGINVLPLGMADVTPAAEVQTITASAAAEEDLAAAACCPLSPRTNARSPPSLLPCAAGRRPSARATKTLATSRTTGMAPASTVSRSTPRERRSA